MSAPVTHPPEAAAGRRRRPGLFERLRRRRWQLVPFAVGMAAYLLALAGCADPAALAAGGAPAVLGGGWLLGRTKLRPREVLYARAVLALAAVWIFLSVVTRFGNVWVQLGNPAVTVLAGIPWWRHRGVRGRVRVENLVGDWPDTADQAGLGGARAVSGTVGVASDRLRLELLRGRQTVGDLAGRLTPLAQVLRVPTHWLRLDEEITHRDPGLVDLLVTHTDPWRDRNGRPIDIEHPGVRDPAGWVARRRTVREPVPYGLDDDGRAATVSVCDRRGGRFVVLTSRKSGGKTVTLNDLLAGLTPARDVDLVLINLKEGGKSTRQWARAPRVVAHATTAAEALRAIDWAIAESGRRAQATDDPVMEPSTRRRCVGVVVDEYSLLVAAAPAAAARLETWSRTMRSAAGFLVMADQRVESKRWPPGLRGQVDTVLCGIMANSRDAQAVFPAYKDVDVTTFPEELGGLMARWVGAGRPVSLSRSYRLEAPGDIAVLVSQCVSLDDGGGVGDMPVSRHVAGRRRGWRDRWRRRDMSVSRRDTGGVAPPTPQDQLPLPWPHVADDADDMTAGESDTAPGGEPGGWPPEPGAGPDEAPPADDDLDDLDRLILREIEDAGALGASMRELTEAVGAPRSTVQARCAALAQREPAPVHARPPRGRHARWYWGPPGNA